MKSATTRFEKVSLAELRKIIPEAVVSTPSITPKLKAKKTRPYHVEPNGTAPKPRSKRAFGKEGR